MGVVDSGYRGEIIIGLNNTSNKTIIISKNFSTKKEKNNKIYYPYNKAIAQAIILPIPTMEKKEIKYEDLLKIPSIRGKGKLGSSGK